MSTSVIRNNNAASTENITNNITWDSTITQAQSTAVKAGNIIMMMFSANRTGSTTKWLLATIPGEYAPPTDRWTGSCADSAGSMRFVRIENESDVYKVYVVPGNTSISYAQGSIAWPIGY